MDWYPLFNSLRIAAVSTVVVFFLGIWLANLVARAPRVIKGILDVVLTLPLVLPPTVVGYLLLILLGPKRPIGAWVMQTFGIKLTMVWYAAIFATTVVSFPLMYRTARGAFESFDHTLSDAAATLGKSSMWTFWRVKMPCCRQGIIAGCVLAFARALGEYGATSMICGYTPGATATVSTTVYQLWRTGDDAGALTWVIVNLAISAVVLLALNLFEQRSRTGRAKEGMA
ncbi:MAG: molybdate ABC transporter permease subunit [Tractidigestivibacter sp.]|jgi:molybdate transport system permease protein|uniref:molybdate ABC transporter permease subunit n=1 Tax=Tractidigestivibacter sp. TaxID=2847320 RepID=UPI003D948E86